MKARLAREPPQIILEQERPDGTVFVGHLLFIQVRQGNNNKMQREFKYSERLLVVEKERVLQI